MVTLPSASESRLEHGSNAEPAQYRQHAISQSAHSFHGKWEGKRKARGKKKYEREKRKGKRNWRRWDTWTGDTFLQLIS